MQGLSLELPTGYYLERDPDILTLRRSDGSVVGAFSAQGVAPEAVRHVVEETASARSTLRACFLGHFEVLCEGEPVPLGRNGKALTILKYLLADPSRPVSQDHLMGWLWPDSSLKKARWSLNSAVHGLRKLLGGCPALLDAKHVVLEEGYYRLRPGLRISTDVGRPRPSSSWTARNGRLAGRAGGSPVPPPGATVDRGGAPGLT